MLLGLLYCSSNRLQRAEKFYELVEIELSNLLSASDEEFKEYIPIMYEISYLLMFRLYDKYREPVTDKKGEAVMPLIDHVSDWLPNEN